MAIELNTRWRSALLAIAGLGAALFTVACDSRDVGGVAAQTITANQAGVPVVVSCEPHQRTLVRPVVVNGATVSQVECVTSGRSDVVAVNHMTVPIAQSAPAYAVPGSRQTSDGLADAQVVPASVPGNRGPARSHAAGHRRRAGASDALGAEERDHHRIVCWRGRGRRRGRRRQEGRAHRRRDRRRRCGGLGPDHAPQVSSNQGDRVVGGPPSARLFCSRPSQLSQDKGVLPLPIAIDPNRSAG